MGYLPAPLVGAFVFIFGLIIGSFLNVVIYRLPIGESLVLPGSHCPKCNSPVKPYDNIPVLSYLILGGKCRHCSARISIIYPIVELLVGVLWLLCYLRDGLTPALAGDLLFVSLIVPLVFIDFHHKLLPNAITYPGFICLLVLRIVAPDPWIVAHTPLWFGLDSAPVRVVALVGALLGALAGGGSLWLVREIYYRVRHVEGMGLGDAKMMLMVGAFLGWQLALLTIFIGSLLGAVIGLIIIKRSGGSMKTEIPFGVFLGPAGIIALFVGQQIWDAYMGMMYS
jgi:leader peptidase (prepilin peptidase)/N-methyltransferase